VKRNSVATRNVIIALAERGVETTGRKIESLWQAGLGCQIDRSQPPTPAQLAHYADAITLTGQGRPTEGVALTLAVRGHKLSPDVVKADALACLPAGEKISDALADVSFPDSHDDSIDDDERVRLQAVTATEARRSEGLLPAVLSGEGIGAGRLSVQDAGMPLESSDVRRSIYRSEAVRAVLFGDEPSEPDLHRQAAEGLTGLPAAMTPRPLSIGEMRNAVETLPIGTLVEAARQVLPIVALTAQAQPKLFDRSTSVEVYAFLFAVSQIVLNLPEILATARNDGCADMDDATFEEGLHLATSADPPALNP
jgi:hypothetical protein